MRTAAGLRPSAPRPSAMRFGVIFQAGTANAHYRAILPMLELERRGHAVLWPGRHDYGALLQGVPEWDLLHVQQFIGPDDLDTVQRLRSHGVAVVWDTDDDALAVPKGSDTWKRLGGRRGIKRVFERTVAMGRAAHLLTTTSEPLAERYRAAGVEHVVVIENFLAPRPLERAGRRRPGVAIGCVAASEHVGDLEALRIAKVLKAILRAHPQATVTALGVDLRLDDPRYAHHPKVPLERLRELVLGFDIGIAPLVDTPFNRARSNVKLKEYAEAGAAWLASPVGPYAAMGEAQGGLLVDDGGWHEAIDALVRDPVRRSELARRGRAWAATQTIRQGGDRWEAAFRAAVVRARRAAELPAAAVPRPSARRAAAARRSHR
jgi:glycosyltransferase involved in cell wall biosynthesis